MVVALTQGTLKVNFNLNLRYIFRTSNAVFNSDCGMSMLFDIGQYSSPSSTNGHKRDSNINLHFLLLMVEGCGF